MARGRKKAVPIKETLDDILKDPIRSMPLTTYREYQEYNKAAREANKKSGYCRYEIKPCPEDLHPKQRIIFGRNDQPSNPLPVYLRNDKIEYKKTLIPGKTYDLPHCICEYLSGKGTPEWKWYDNPDGSRETRKASTTPRFALRTVYAE